MSATLCKLWPRGLLKRRRDDGPKVFFEKSAASAVGVVPVKTQDIPQVHYGVEDLIANLDPYKTPAISITYPGRFQSIDGLGFLGGYPVLPSALRWPYADFEDLRIAGGEPMHFIGQFDLAQLPVLTGAKYRLPTRGILYFFVHASDRAWQKTSGRVLKLYKTRVLYSGANPQGLEIRPAPAEMPPAMGNVSVSSQDLPQGILPNRPVAFQPVWSVPGPAFTKTHLQQSGSEPIFAPGDFLMAADRICGVQNVHNPAPGAYALGYGADNRTQKDFPDIAGYILLMQFNTDANMHWFWGEHGALQIWIRPEDLASHDFSRVIAIS